MKYAFMTFSCPELDLDGVLDLAGRMGYDGIEPRLDSKHAHGVEVAPERNLIGAVPVGAVGYVAAEALPHFGDEAAEILRPSSDGARQLDADAQPVGINLSGELGVR